MSNSSSGKRKKKATFAPAGVPSPTPTPAAATPSGVTYDQFKAMSEQEKYNLIDSVVNDKKIKVPDYLDDSLATKVMYALGINNKPEMVSDAEFNKLEGEAMYRTVSSSQTVTGKNISAKEIINQIKTSDYTRFPSTDNAKAGQALYFANNFRVSALYGNTEDATVMRSKVKKDAKLVSINQLLKLQNNAYNKSKTFHSDEWKELAPLTAIVHGYDGWYDKRLGYTMIVNRGSLVTTSSNKKALHVGESSAALMGRLPRVYTSWNTAPDA